MRFQFAMCVVLWLAWAVSVRADEIKHWAYVPPVRPSLPAVSHSTWPRNAVDFFVLQRLENDKRMPSPEAERETLLRRITYSLTGLPPTLEELDLFLSDNSPDAYEKVIDRLLASPRYGERLAQHWLDLARYADTHGYHADTHRDMWRWRDWVIEAYNRDVPFDQFTIDQLAGDLLPEPTLDQLIATGFNRNHMINFENGAIPAQYRNEYVVDRVNTTSTVWLAQSLECTRCHDHKHDPYTQKDFYRLYAFFNNVPENGLDGQRGNAAPYISAPTREQQFAMKQAAEAIDQLEVRMRAMALAAEGDVDWEARLKANTKLLPPPNDMSFYFPFDEKNGGKTLNAVDRVEAAIHGDAIWLKGKLNQSLLFDSETHVELAAEQELRYDARWTLAAWIFPTTADEMSILASVENMSPHLGTEVYLQNQKLHVAVRHGEKKKLVVASQQEISVSRWQAITVAYDGSGRAAGVRLFINGLLQMNEVADDSLHADVPGGPPIELVSRIGRRGDEFGFRGMLDDVRYYSRLLTNDEVSLLSGHNPMADLMAIPSARRTQEQEVALRRFYLETSQPEYQRLQTKATDLRRHLDSLRSTSPTTMVMREMPQSRETFLLMRGQYDLPGVRVEVGTPVSLPSLRFDAKRSANRLDLARWILDQENPLTARVAVNRFWQLHFGQGIVRTLGDFGTHGESPSHPQLLDWLAEEFRSSTSDAAGWSMKRLQRLLLTSATFRQSSKVTGETLQRDPHNRLLGRGPRSRLPAESIRDTALFVSGLLHPVIGGQSVFPYQPPGLWEEVAYDPRSLSAQTYRQSHGAELYRRALYVFWKRAVPPPSLAILDAPDREVCSVDRPVSNTPLQALVLMNETALLESARMFALRAMTHAEDADRRATYLFRSATSRLPNDQEMEILLQTFRAQLAEFRRDENAAARVVKVGEYVPEAAMDLREWAAWTTVANMVLSLDEALTNR